MVTQKEILDLIRDNEGIIQSTLPERLNGSSSNIGRVITQLKKKKMIRQEVYGASWKLYLVKDETLPVKESSLL